MARLDPRGSAGGRHVRPGPAAHGDRQARSRWPECQHRRSRSGELERVSDRVGELRSIAACRGDLHEQVEQVIGCLAVLKAAEQDQVAAPGQHTVARNGEEPWRVPVATAVLAAALFAHTSLPP